ncbi:MAG TPA: SDR family oxidoreductase [Blastococcus sp.]|nr:SDR family oxidoreductase [Blastococcus sp.]
MILVAGGTGRLGSEVVGRLVARGEPVRVLTRDPQRAAHLPAVEVAVGDVRRPADLTTAMRGVHSVVSAVHGFAGRGVSPASVDRDGNSVLIDAAVTVGAHVVLVSVLGASPTHPIELFRMKAAAEERLRESGAPWTIVRAGAFLQLYQDLMRRTAGRSGRPLVFGRGNNPISFASVPDVAAAVDEALHDPSLRKTVMEVAGVIVTFNQLAAALEPDLGPGARRPRHVPRSVLRVLASAGSTPPGRQAAAALVMDTYDLTA